MKKVLAVLLTLMMSMSIVACSGSKVETDTPETTVVTSKEESTEGEQPAEQKDVTLDIFQFKVEIVDQLEALVGDFQTEYPYIKVNLDTTGGGEDYGVALKTRMNSGNMPAIFNVPGPTERDLWIDYLEDLKNETWVADCAAGTLDNISVDGKVLGQPMNIEGYGIMYNKAILTQAGITEAEIANMDTLTELRAMFQKVEQQKETLGLEATFGWTVGGTGWWVAAYHTFNIPFAMQEKPLDYVAGLYAGTSNLADNDRMLAFQNLVDTFIEFSYSDVGAIDYEKQYSDFAAGKTAFMQQGNWTINQLLEIDSELDIAFLPIPISDDSNWNNDSIPVGVPNYWVVNSKLDAEVIAAAKLFLDYIANSPRGHQFLIEDAKFIPAFTDVDATAADPLAQSILTYTAAGKTIPWTWHAFPSGMNENDAKQAFQDYGAGSKSWTEVLAFLDEKWDEKAK